MNGTATQNAPSSYIVTSHFLVGGTAWLLAMILLLFNPDTLTQHFFNPKLLSLTHLLVLSWVTTIILGALYQLLPVILLCKLYSEKLAIASFILLQLGSIGIFLCFWNAVFNYPLIISGILVCLSIALFCFNLCMTIRKSTVKRIEKTFILSSIVWLALTVSIGLLLAINFSFPFLQISHLEILKLHAHFGIVGWFIQLIIGISSVLLPMFFLAHNLKKKPLHLSFYLLNAALVLGALSKIFHLEIGIPISLLLGITSIGAYLYFIFIAYQKRLKRKLDVGMKKSVLSLAFLLIPLGLSIPIFFNHRTETHFLAIAYFITLLIGVISSLIMGQTFKTLPFIIWLKTYKSFIGKEKTPLPKDLYSHPLVRWQNGIHFSGFALLLFGISFHTIILITVGLSLLVLAALLYYKNIIAIIFHKRITHGNTYSK